MISILTPTYNRGNLLLNLYNSLCKQTVKKFEWIVIDDGSSDNTESIVRQLIDNQCEFNISYFKTLNGGKHRAINFGINKVTYDYIFIVDSDDILEDKAIECIESWIKTIEGDESFAGVSGLKGYNSYKIIGEYPTLRDKSEYIDSTNLDRKKNKLLGDKAEIYKTSVLKKYRFPEFQGEKFITEASVWNQIAYDGYKIRWFNKIIYIADYLSDGLTRMGTKKEVDNFQGFTYFIKLRIKTEKNFFNIAPICSFCNIARKKNISKLEISRILGVNLVKIYFCYYIDLIYRRIRSSHVY